MLESSLGSAALMEPRGGWSRGDHMRPRETLDTGQPSLASWGPMPTSL